MHIHRRTHTHTHTHTLTHKHTSTHIPTHTRTAFSSLQAIMSLVGGLGTLFVLPISPDTPLYPHMPRMCGAIEGATLAHAPLLSPFLVSACFSIFSPVGHTPGGGDVRANMCVSMCVYARVCVNTRRLHTILSLPSFPLMAYLCASGSSCLWVVRPVGGVSLVPTLLPFPFIAY